VKAGNLSREAETQGAWAEGCTKAATWLHRAPPVSHEGKTSSSERPSAAARRSPEGGLNADFANDDDSLTSGGGSPCAVTSMTRSWIIVGLKAQGPSRTCNESKEGMVGTLHATLDRCESKAPWRDIMRQQRFLFNNKESEPSPCQVGVVRRS